MDAALLLAVRQITDLRKILHSQRLLFWMHKFLIKIQLIPTEEI